jgi:hypothetical protein
MNSPGDVNRHFRREERFSGGSPMKKPGGDSKSRRAMCPKYPYENYFIRIIFLVSTIFSVVIR